MTIDACKFGLAGGIISALFMLLLALCAGFAGLGSGMLDTLSTIYVGYKAGVLGGAVGALYGFIEGFLSFYLIAWVYDRLLQQKSA